MLGVINVMPGIFIFYQMKTYQITERVVLDRNTFIEVPDDMQVEEIYEQFLEGNPKIKIKDIQFDNYNEDIIEHEVNELPWRKDKSCQTQE